jgi:hypothetical protein
MNVRRIAIPLLVLVCCAYAQDAPLTKDTIIQMTKVGLPDDVIVGKIRSEARPPKMSADDLIALKSAGVSDGVLRALVAPPPVADPPAGMTLTVNRDQNDPMSPHDPGIYMMKNTEDGGRKLVLMERAGAGHEKSSNLWAYVFSYGIAKMQIKAQIPGRQADLRTTEERPVFYMYFPAVGNLGAGDAITSPSQFSLLSLEEAKDHRETAVAKMGLGTASEGNDDKRTIKLTTEKIRPYSYMVTPDVSLKPGEYAFVAASGVGGSASSGSVVIFDFGVDAK